jgi:hypothetical protein
MDDFPAFMKNPKNRVENKDQYSKDIEGYYYTAPDGQQMAFWTAHTAGTSAPHTHPFDEYMVCVQGQYVVLIGGKEIVLESSDEYLIPRLPTNRRNQNHTRIRRQTHPNMKSLPTFLNIYHAKSSKAFMP